MAYRTVNDIMVKDVVSARSGDRYKQLVSLLSSSGVRALPIVDIDHRVVGIVSEVDLMHKVARDEPFSRLRRMTSRRHPSGDFAWDVMTKPPVTITPEASTLRAASLLERHDVGQLPVVDAEDHLLGMVTRPGLLEVFLRDDQDIRAEINERVLGSAHHEINVSVDHGTVRLSGTVDWPGFARAMVAGVKRVEGVVSVVDLLHTA